jgi:hypothetical protein
MKCGGIPEYLVTIKNENTEGEMRVFQTEQEARKCYQTLIPYKDESSLLEKFKTYV